MDFFPTFYETDIPCPKCKRFNLEITRDRELERTLICQVCGFFKKK